MQPEASDVPFVGLLIELRERGFAVGLREFQHMVTLAERWQSVDRNSFRDAIAALIARNAEEVAQIRLAFDEWADAELTPATDRAPQPPQPVSRLRAWHIAVLVLLLASAGIAIVKRRVDHIRAKKPAVVQVTGGEPTPPIAETPTTPEPQLPPPPREHVRNVPWPAASVGVAVALLLLAVRRARSKQDRWMRGYWRQFLEKKPGPHHYDYRVRPLAPPLPRRDVEDVATILGRAQETDTSSGERLAVDESLRLTLRAGLRPHLVFEPPPRNVPVIVLQDVGWQMRPWQSKIDYFLGELIRQGVLMERWYFDGDPLFVSRAPRERTVSLASLTARQSDASLMVLSTGQSITSEALDALARILPKWMFRAWVNPIGNLSYWRRELERLPVRVWPMTSAGVRAAAVEVARGRDSGPSPSSASRRAVTRGDMERMQQLIALVPQPSLELAEELRRRFAPDIPEEVLLFLGAEGVFYGETIRFPPEQLKRLLAESRDPERERDVRRYLLEVLRESEPPAESVAHIRWQIDEAIHRLQLDERSDARETLRQLAQGPLADEVLTALALVESKKIEQVARTAGKPLPDELPEPPPESLGKRPPLFAWPNWNAALIAALLIAAATYIVARVLPAVNGDPIPHRVGAYQLMPLSTAGSYVVKTVEKSAPASVTMYRNGKALPDLPVAIGTPVDIPAADRGAWFEVRATLPRGNLATSRPQWVPSASTRRTLPEWVSDWIAERVVAALAQRFRVAPESIKADAPLASFAGANRSAMNDVRGLLFTSLRFNAPLGDLDKLETVSDLADYYRKNTVDALVTLTFANESGVAIPGATYTLQSDTLSAQGTAGVPLVVRPALYAVVVGTATVGTVDPGRRESVTRQFVVKGPEGTLHIVALPRDVPVRNLRIVRASTSIPVTSTTMKLAPGRYRLTLEDDFHSWSADFAIAANQVTNVSADVKPTYGAVRLSTTTAVAAQLRKAIPHSSLRQVAGSVWILRAPPGHYRVPLEATSSSIELTIEAGKETLGPQPTKFPIYVTQKMLYGCRTRGNICGIGDVALAGAHFDRGVIQTQTCEGCNGHSEVSFDVPAGARRLLFFAGNPYTGADCGVPTKTGMRLSVEVDGVTRWEGQVQWRGHALSGDIPLAPGARRIKLVGSSTDGTVDCDDSVWAGVRFED